MRKILLSLVLLLISAYADNPLVEKTVVEYEKKAFYHEFIQEYKLALEYHKRGCDLGEGVACANAGVLYWNGHIDNRSNKKMTVEYSLRGCELGNAYSCRAVAISYDEAWLGEKDMAKALHYCQKAYLLGSKEACEMLGLPNPDLVSMH